MNRKVIEVLDKFHARFPGFKVQHFIKGPCPWVEYRSKEYERYLKQYGSVNHRQLMIDEVLIDIDSKSLEEGIPFADKVEEKLKDKGMAYERWNSGGNGIHFHLYFPQLIEFKDDKQKRNRLKRKIIYWLLDDLKGDKLLDMYTKQLVQIEYAVHRKGGTKTLIVREEGNWPVNMYPTFLNDEYDKELSDSQQVRRNMEPIIGDLNCIKYLMGEKVNDEIFIAKQDGMYRAMFSLAAWYKRCQKTTEETTEILLKWYKKIPLQWRRASSRTINERVIRTTVAKTNGSMGCNYKRDLMEDLNCVNVCKGCPYNIWEKEK